jgi:transcription antitermination factor NusG
MLTLEPSDAAGRDGANSEPWFACYTRARQEKKVDRLLKQRRIESYLPLITRERSWHDRRKRMLWPLFPSYVFVRFPRSELVTILSTPGVATMVRLSGRLAPIPHDEIMNVANFAERYPAREELPRLVLFVPGQRVRVMHGEFEGITGVVIHSRGGKRIVVGLGSIGLGFEINVRAEVLEPIDPVAAA